MTARVLNTESLFRIGTVMRLPMGPLLKKLSYTHCSKLTVGERIWLPDKETGAFIAVTVTKISKGGGSILISFNGGIRSGYFPVSSNDKNTVCYRFLDEETLVSENEVSKPLSE